MRLRKKTIAVIARCLPVPVAAAITVALLLAGGCDESSSGKSGKSAIYVSLNSNGLLVYKGKAMPPKAFAARLTALHVPKNTMITISLQNPISEQSRQAVFRDICTAGYHNVCMVTPMKATSLKERQ